VLEKKFQDSVAAHFSERQTEAILALFSRKDFGAVPVTEFMAALVAN